MNFLIVVATKYEIDSLLVDLKIIKINSENSLTCLYNGNNVEILVTGIGIYNTIYHLTKHLQNNSYDLVINAGIAGSFSEKIQIGTSVEVFEESFLDVLISNNNIKSLFEYGLMKDDDFFENGILKNKDKQKNELIKVRGITSNSINHNNDFNNLISKKFNADIETMEGAAFFYVCMKEKTKFIQIRSISNYVGESDKSKWDIQLAKSELSKSIINLIDN